MPDLCFHLLEPVFLVLVYIKADYHYPGILLVNEDRIDIIPAVFIIDGKKPYLPCQKINALFPDLTQVPGIRSLKELSPVLRAHNVFRKIIAKVLVIRDPHVHHALYVLFLHADTGIPGKIHVPDKPQHIDHGASYTVLTLAYLYILLFQVFSDR